MNKVQYFSAKDNLTAEYLVTQLTIVTESDENDTRLSTKTTKNGLLNKTQENTYTQSTSIDTCTDSLDTNEIAELKISEQGKTMKMKSKAQKKLDQEKAIQRK